MPQKLIYFLSRSHIRSVIAEAWAKKLPIGDVTFISGSWRASQKNHLLEDALQEFSIELPQGFSFIPNKNILMNADLIILIYDSSYELVPTFPEYIQNKVIYWDIQNPEHETEQIRKWTNYQEVCENIALSVKNLGKELFKI